MSEIDLQKAFDLIFENMEIADFEGEKDDTLIELAEKALGLPFPPTYKRFIKKYGCGDIAGQEYYGIIDDNFHDSAIPNAVWLTLEERKSGFPVNLIIIYAAGDGAYYALDAEQKTTSGEYPVVSWTPGLSTSSAEVASDFGEFLLKSLQKALR